MKKSSSKSKSAPKAKEPDADFHRKMASTYSAKADLADAQNPKKRPGPYC